jgi:hypothetical protein
MTANRSRGARVSPPSASHTISITIDEADRLDDVLVGIAHARVLLEHAIERTGASNAEQRAVLLADAANLLIPLHIELDALVRAFWDRVRKRARR